MHSFFVAIVARANSERDASIGGYSLPTEAIDFDVAHRGRAHTTLHTAMAFSCCLFCTTDALLNVHARGAAMIGTD
jgi:hypothetical protein